MYTSGKGSSAAGLTASVVRDSCFLEFAPLGNKIRRLLRVNYIKKSRIEAQCREYVLLNIFKIKYRY